MSLLSRKVASQCASWFAPCPCSVPLSGPMKSRCVWAWLGSKLRQEERGPAAPWYPPTLSPPRWWVFLSLQFAFGSDPCLRLGPGRCLGWTPGMVRASEPQAARVRRKPIAAGDGTSRAGAQQVRGNK